MCYYVAARVHDSGRACVCVKVEKRLDLVKQVTHGTHKKLTACLQGQQGADIEKRSVKSPSVSNLSIIPSGAENRCKPEASLMLFLSTFCQKKLPLTILAQCMVEGAAVLGDDSLLG